MRLYDDDDDTTTTTTTNNNNDTVQLLGSECNQIS